MDSLVLLPPPTDTPWSGMSDRPVHAAIPRSDGTQVSFELPLFWYDPPWCNASAQRADMLASAVAYNGITIAAMHSDLAGPDRESHYFASLTAGEIGIVDDVSPRGKPAGHILPYRAERYGLDSRDFDQAKVVDVRLTMFRDAFGRFAYSPAQLERWEATPSSEPLAGGGWVPAATFPPDVVSFDHLSTKIGQLRILAPDAAVLVSVAPYRLDSDIPAIVAAQPDGVILRLDDALLDGLQLATLTQKTRRLLDRLSPSPLSLWVVPDEITPDDAVKLLTLGASAVAVDSWCDPLVAEAAHQQPTVAARLGSKQASAHDEEYLLQLIHYQLSARIERVKGLWQTTVRQPLDERLGSFDRDWAEKLGVRQLS